MSDRRLGSARRGRRPAGEAHWLSLSCHPEIPEPASDPLSQAELGKDRARLLLARYGVVSRDILAHELSALRWNAVFDSLRLLELSGEALSGHFFDSLPGPQFLEPGLLDELERFREDTDAAPVFWLSARDPASPCGLATHEGLPARMASSYLVFCGRRLVVVTLRQSRSCTIHSAPDDSRLPEYLAFLHSFAHRESNPETRVVVESINGERAPDSPYLWAFEKLGFRSERGYLVYWAPYR
jgi:ATP-dependent Lhr-like helicase